MNLLYDLRFTVYGAILAMTIQLLFILFGKGADFLNTVLLAILLYPLVYILDKKYVRTDEVVLKSYKK